MLRVPHSRFSGYRPLDTPGWRTTRTPAAQARSLPPVTGTQAPQKRSATNLRRAVARLAGAATMTWLLAAAFPARAADLDQPLSRLVAAYPDFLVGIDGQDLVWKDGSHTPLRTHQPNRSHDAVLADPDVADIVAEPYRPGPIAPPVAGADPGRARPAIFFDKMYGDCRRGEVAPHLVTVPWLGPNGTTKIRVTRTNGVDIHLAAVSAELARLPAAERIDLLPPAGGYNCRAVAGTDRRSPHGWGIAVDIATHRSDYWLWAGHKPGGLPPWRNRISPKIVAIFEAHGFVWGGRWSHFDTMHFEYRPELLAQPR